MNDNEYSILSFIVASLLIVVSQAITEKYGSKLISYFIFIAAMILFWRSFSLIEGLKNINDFIMLICVFIHLFYIISIMHFTRKIIARKVKE